ncbi:MAG: MFS transporter [Desulfobacteraceae bacterium]|nr:MFS transporter [Desulfobacteraceae bacterium]
MANNRSIIALNLSVFLFMFGVGMIVPILPQKIITLTGSFKTVGYLASAFAVSFVLLQLPIGRLSDRFGFRGFLLAGYLTCSISGLLYCFSNTQEMIFFGRMLQGIGEAPLWALAPALLSILYPGARGKVIGLYNAAIHMGLTLGSVAGILVSSVWVKNQPFLLFALSGILGALLILVAVEDPDRTDSVCDAPMDTGSLKKLATDPDTLAVFSGIILYGAGYGIFLTVLPGFLIQDKGFTQTGIGWFFMLFYVAVSLSQVITGPLSDRHGRRKTMIFGLLAVFLGLGLFPAKEGWEIHPWLFLASFGLGVFCVSALAWLNDAVGDSLKGTVSGAFYLFWGMGFFSGPLLLESPETRFNGLTGFHMLAMFYFFQAFLLALIRHRRGKFYKDRV